MKKRKGKPHSKPRAEAEAETKTRRAGDYDPEPGRKLSPAVEEAVAIATDILYLIEEKVSDDAKERVAPDFFDSVRKKAASIRQKSQRFNSVSERQLDSLKNMLRGVKKWVHDDDEDDDDE